MVGVIIVHQAFMEKAKRNLSKNSVTTLEKSPTKQGRFTQSRIRTNERSRTTSAMMAWPTPNRNAWDVVYGSTNAQWLSKRHGPTTILKTVECGCKTGHVVMWLQKDRSSTHSIMILSTSFCTVIVKHSVVMNLIYIPIKGKKMWPDPLSESSPLTLKKT